jgi:hydroxypyruvate isomerase
MIERPVRRFRAHVCCSGRILHGSPVVFTQAERNLLIEPINPRAIPGYFLTPQADGKVNYHYLFRLLDELGYAGWVGCEYRPRGRTEDGLAARKNP